jgi:serine/threonine protein kinase
MLSLAKDTRQFGKIVTIHKIPKSKQQANKNDLVKILREIQILKHVKHSNMVELEYIFESNSNIKPCDMLINMQFKLEPSRERKRYFYRLF